jgi:hypothetical protein
MIELLFIFFLNISMRQYLVLLPITNHTLYTRNIFLFSFSSLTHRKKKRKRERERSSMHMLIQN